MFLQNSHPIADSCGFLLKIYLHVILIYGNRNFLQLNKSRDLVRHRISLHTCTFKDVVWSFMLPCHLEITWADIFMFLFALWVFGSLIIQLNSGAVCIHSIMIPHVQWNQILSIGFITLHAHRIHKDPLSNGCAMKCVITYDLRLLKILPSRHSTYMKISVPSRLHCRVSTTPGILLILLENLIVCRLNYDNMPTTEQNLVTYLNTGNCHLTIICAVLFIKCRFCIPCCNTSEARSV